MKQRVSVIIPFYLRYGQLDRAIRSALDQTLPPAEIILVDDCSPGEGFDISRYDDERIRLYRHECNRGPGAARNTGLRHATGELICFLDSDDYWRPEFLASTAAALREAPEASFAYAYAMEIRQGKPSGRRRKNNRPYHRILPNILNGGRPWGTCCCLWRRETIDRVGSWLEIRCWEDYNFEARAAAAVSNSVCCVPRVLCYIEVSTDEEKIPQLPPVDKLLHKSLAISGIIAAVQGSPLGRNAVINRYLRRLLFSCVVQLSREKRRRATMALAFTARQNDLLSFVDLIVISLGAWLPLPWLTARYHQGERRRLASRKG